MAWSQAVENSSHPFPGPDCRTILFLGWAGLDILLQFPKGFASEVKQVQPFGANLLFKKDKSWLKGYSICTLMNNMKLNRIMLYHPWHFSMWILFKLIFSIQGSKKKEKERNWSSHHFAMTHGGKLLYLWYALMLSSGNSMESVPLAPKRFWR